MIHQESIKVVKGGLHPAGRRLGFELEHRTVLARKRALVQTVLCVIRKGAEMTIRERMSIQKRKRPRALTLTLSDEKQPFLVLQGKKYTLRNFSEEGIGLWLVPPAPYNLTAGSKITGDIVIENVIHPVQLEVMHLSDRGVGLKITNKSQELTTLFNRLLEPTTYAALLKPHAQSRTEDKDMQTHRLWFTGDAGTELIVWYQNNSHTILAVQLVWVGKWVFREQFKPAMTGQINETHKLGSGTKVPGSALLVQHATADGVLLQQAAQFLASAPPPLPGYLFWQFLESGEQVHLPIELFQAPKVA